MAKTVQIVVQGLGSARQATVSRWLKRVGEPVLAFEPVVELRTDRLTVELRAPSVGTLATVSAGVGEAVLPGAEIATVVPGAPQGKWAVYGSEPSWRREFPLLSQVATWLGWKGSNR